MGSKSVCVSGVCKSIKEKRDETERRGVLKTRKEKKIGLRTTVDENVRVVRGPLNRSAEMLFM